MIPSYRLMKPPCCSLLIDVFPVFDQGSWQKLSHASNSRWHKLKRDQIRPKGPSQPKLILGYPPWKIINCTMPNMQNHANLKSSVTKNELFMIVKLDVASSAESPFSILFCYYKCTNFWWQEQVATFPPFCWEPCDCQLTFQQPFIPNCKVIFCLSVLK